MPSTKLRTVILAAAVAAFAPLVSGCYAEMEPPESVYVEEGGYHPMYYDGYVVYFDGGGRPYYYVNGSVYWVPRSYAYYGAYVAHYNTYWRSYRTWYARGGYRYHYYRAAPRRWR
jgi:hypothetical protein